MRKVTPFLSALALAAVLVSGCAGPEEKFGRGMSNTFEVVRMGEMRRTIEQTTIMESPSAGATTGFMRGLNRSMARTGLGVYEMITAPVPSYHFDTHHWNYGPVCTSYLTPGPAFPESYKPGRMSDALFDTDTFTGFSGGDIAPWFPGSRFRVFDN